MTSRLFITGLTALLLSAGCQEFPSEQSFACAPFDEFQPVSAVMERRCATLDCHGQLARPLRLYSARGMRRIVLEEEVNDPTNVTAGRGLTNEELYDNWRSVCGVEPEVMDAIQRGEAQATDHLMMRKSLGIERHKGDILFIKGDEGSKCLSGWLEGNLEPAFCDLAILDP